MCVVGLSVGKTYHRWTGPALLHQPSPTLRSMPRILSLDGDTSDDQLSLRALTSPQVEPSQSKPLAGVGEKKLNQQIHHKHDVHHVIKVVPKSRDLSQWLCKIMGAQPKPKHGSQQRQR